MVRVTGCFQQAAVLAASGGTPLLHPTWHFQACFLPEPPCSLLPDPDTLQPQQLADASPAEAWVLSGELQHLRDDPEFFWLRPGGIPLR